MGQEKIGAFICRLRKERGMTQKELADQFHVTDKAVSKWERGQSYPDITLISALAETLGVTERELLQGEREGGALSLERVIPDIREDPQKSVQQKTGRLTGILMSGYTVALLLAIFVNSLCDVLLNGRFTWSLIVAASCVAAWGVVAPFYYLKKRRLFWAAAVVTVLTPCLLWLIAPLDPMGGTWFPWPALPILATWIAWAWLPILLHTFTHISKWYLAALAAFLAAPANWYTNMLANGWDYMGTQALTQLSAVSSGVALLIVGMWFAYRGRRNRWGRYSKE